MVSSKHHQQIVLLSYHSYYNAIYYMTSVKDCFLSFHLKENYHQQKEDNKFHLQFRHCLLILVQLQNQCFPIHQLFILLSSKPVVQFHNHLPTILQTYLLQFQVLIKRLFIFIEVVIYLNLLHHRPNQRPFSKEVVPYPNQNLQPYSI